MQKLITVTINVEKLQSANEGAFTISEVEEINAILEDGWNVEEWEFITSDQETEKAVLLVVLNNEPAEPEFDAELFTMEQGDNDDEEEEEFNDDEEDEKKEMEHAGRSEQGMPSVH